MAARPLTAVFAGILLFVAGLSVGVWTFEQWRAGQDRLEAAARAQGTVKGEVNGRPLISFALPNGDRVTFTAAADRAEYPDGRQVDVLYRTDLPSEAVIDRPRARWIRTGLLGALSLAVMALGAYVAWYARRYDARR